MSIMKRNILLISLMSIGIVYFEGVLNGVVFMICIGYILFRFKKKGLLCVVLLACILFRSLIMIHNTPATTLKVIDIRTNYCIASDGFNKVILYNLDSVNLYDSIRVKGTYEEIQSTMNDGAFNFKAFMNHRNIYYSMYVLNYKVVNESKSLCSILYRKVQTLEEEHKNLLNIIFYRINEEDNSYQTYLYMSGMHLSFLILLISKILKKDYHIISIIVCFVYILLFPMSYYIQRIFIFSIIELFMDWNKKEKLGLSIFLLLMINPNSIYEIGFILPLCFKLASNFNVSKLNKKWLSISIMIPIFLYNFSEINLISILIFSFYRVIYGFIFIVSILSLFIPKSIIFVKYVLDFLNYLTTYKISNICIIGKPYVIWMIVWIFIVLEMLKQKQFKYYVYIIGLLFIQIQMKNINPFYEITFLDVGQGDCILIREPFNGKVMLIDCAGKVDANLPKTNIIPYLKKEGINKIDIISISHDDYDHSGGIKQLKQYIDVKEVVYEKVNIELMYSEFISISNQDYDEANDNSVVLYSDIYDTRFLFMGDASKYTETNILKEYGNLKADVIKVGHHGSNTSSDEDFIHQINPKYGIISAGRNNKYGHPHQKTLDILNKNNVQILNTQTDGSISFYLSKYISFIKIGNNGGVFKY